MGDFCFACVFFQWYLMNLNYLFIKSYIFKSKNGSTKFDEAVKVYPLIKLKQFFFVKVERTNKRLINVHDCLKPNF